MSSPSLRACAPAALLALVLLMPAQAAAGVAAARPCAEEVTERPVREGFVAAVVRNAPAVVQVVVIRAARDPMEEAEGFEFFQPLAAASPSNGSGTDLERTFSSGFIIDASGYVLTSAHAVFDAQEIWLLLADGRRFAATVLGLDRRTDVALLKIEATGLPVVRIASEPRLCPGAWLAALGAPFGFERSVTVGVVSAYPRYMHGSEVPLIQSDVVLNPGSSGGPLFNADGLVVGMSSMIYSASGIYIGVSFALPIDDVARVAAKLRASGGVSRGDIGARLQPLTLELARAFGLDEDYGALVVRVDSGGPADAAGLRTGDVILSVGRTPRSGQPGISDTIAAAAPGSELPLEIWREGVAMRKAVKVIASKRDTPPPRHARADGAEARLGLVLVPTASTSSGPQGVHVEAATGSGLLAGLERGDRIVAVNGMPVRTPAEFDAALRAFASRSVVALLVVRGTMMSYLPVTR